MQGCRDYTFYFSALSATPKYIAPYQNPYPAAAEAAQQFDTLAFTLALTPAAPLSPFFGALGTIAGCADSGMESVSCIADIGDPSAPDPKNKAGRRW